MGKVLNRFKVAKHFTLEIEDAAFSFSSRQEEIASEAALDGIYVLRMSLPRTQLSTSEVVSSYKALSGVERAFRALATDLDIRPIRHRTAERVRAHVSLRMLSYYVTFHMERALAPMPFKDDSHDAAEATRTSPVAPATRSARALAEAATKRTSDRLPVHSFQSLLGNLATIAANRIKPTDSGLDGFTLITTPTPVQRRAFQLLDVSHMLG